jgi:hypothetical protein
VFPSAAFGPAAEAIRQPAHATVKSRAQIGDNPGLPSPSCSHSAQEKLGPLVPLTWRAFLLVARLIREGSPSPPLAGITAVSLCSVVMKHPHDHTGTGAFGGKRIEGPPRLYSR